MDSIPALQFRLYSIFWVRMLEKAAPLRVTAHNLQPQSMALTQYYVCRPHLDIDRGYLPRQDWFNVRGVVIPMWQVVLVRSAGGVDSAQRNTKQALDYRNKLAGGTDVEDLETLG
jgi:hypothetical protein